MDVVTVSELERHEVESVLRSGLFDKATRLEMFFRYVCDQYFAGRAEHIKEYSIALEALGRSSTFDPKKDSIVRVEAHRLRKRLEQYYRGEGASHAVQVSIPNGQYRPLFCLKEFCSKETAIREPAILEQTVVEEPPPLTTETSSLPVSKSSRNWSFYSLATAAIFVLILISLAGKLHPRTTQRKPTAQPAGQAAAVDEIWQGVASEPLAAESRILAGYHGSPVADRQGHTWTADSYYAGGVSAPIPPVKVLESGPDAGFLKSRRAGRFNYDIPLRPGSYELHLYFAETEFGNGNPGGGGDSTRIFDVTVNGSAGLEGFDVLGQAGAPNRIIGQVFKDISPAADGKLHLHFEPSTAAAFLNAIEILPSAPGRIHPIRIVAQPEPVTDSDGRLWAADEYFSGGLTVLRPNSVQNPPERTLYQGERFGNFCYRIPLARGKYRLTLHFAETFFGTFAFQQDPLNRRIFNVFANGTALLRDFQVIKAAGGPNRSVVRVFENMEPNAQGMLLLEFTPVKNYAEVNAIEVVETS